MIRNKKIILLLKLARYFRKEGKIIFDNIKNEQVRQNLLKAIPFWVGSLIVGMIAVFYARMFVLTESLLMIITHYANWLLFILMPGGFFLSWWLVKRYARYAGGSGIPQVMAALELSNHKNPVELKRLLSLRIIIIKILSSFCLALSGGAIGREGPTIQISGSVFKLIHDVLPKWWPKISMRNMILTGAAAGLSAAFNTPLGGIVFAVEELTKIHFNYFKTTIFTAVIIAGLMAQQLAGPYLYLGYPKTGDISNHVFFAVIIVAVATSFCSLFLAKTLLLLIRWKNSFTKRAYEVLYVLTCGLLMATVAYFFSNEILGSGKTLMQMVLFTSNNHVTEAAPLYRLLGPLFSFSIGGAGGIFAPALSIGASIGSLFSGWFHFNNIDTNVMILAGMVGFLTGITKAPFTSAILVLEMTDRHSLILHLMAAAIISNFITAGFSKHSFYESLKMDYLKRLLPVKQHDRKNISPTL